MWLIFLIGTTFGAKQNIVVFCPLKIEKYEWIDPKIKGHKWRLRKAFTKDTTLLQSLKAAFDFQK